MCLDQEVVWIFRLDESIVASTMLLKPRFFLMFFFRTITVAFILQYGFAME